MQSDEEWIVLAPTRLDRGMDCQGAHASVPRLERVGVAQFTRSLHLRHRPDVLAGLTDSWLCRREWAAGANALEPAWDGLAAAWSDDDMAHAHFPVVECPSLSLSRVHHNTPLLLIPATRPHD